MPKRTTITLSDPLALCADILRKRRHYRTLREYIEGLVRYDGQSQKAHHLTAEWAALSGYERDALDAAILRQVESGEGLHGSWLEARIEESVRRILAEGGAPEVPAVAADLARSIITRHHSKGAP